MTHPVENVEYRLQDSETLALKILVAEPLRLGTDREPLPNEGDPSRIDPSRSASAMNVLRTFVRGIVNLVNEDPDSCPGVPPPGTPQIPANDLRGVTPVLDAMRCRDGTARTFAGTSPVTAATKLVCARYAIWWGSDGTMRVEALLAPTACLRREVQIWIKDIQRDRAFKGRIRGYEYKVEKEKRYHLALPPLADEMLQTKWTDKDGWRIGLKDGVATDGSKKSNLLIEDFSEDEWHHFVWQMSWDQDNITGQKRSRDGTDVGQAARILRAQHTQTIQCASEAQKRVAIGVMALEGQRDRWPTDPFTLATNQLITSLGYKDPPSEYTVEQLFCSGDGDAATKELERPQLEKHAREARRYAGPFFRLINAPPQRSDAPDPFTFIGTAHFIQTLAWKLSHAPQLVLPPQILLKDLAHRKTAKSPSDLARGITDRKMPRELYQEDLRADFGRVTDKTYSAPQPRVYGDVTRSFHCLVESIRANASNDWMVFTSKSKAPKQGKQWGPDLYTLSGEDTDKDTDKDFRIGITSIEGSGRMLRISTLRIPNEPNEIVVLLPNVGNMVTHYEASVSWGVAALDTFATTAAKPHVYAGRDKRRIAGFDYVNRFTTEKKSKVTLTVKFGFDRDDFSYDTAWLRMDGHHETLPLEAQSDNGQATPPNREAAGVVYPVAPLWASQGQTQGLLETIRKTSDDTSADQLHITPAVVLSLRTELRTKLKAITRRNMSEEVGVHAAAILALYRALHPHGWIEADTSTWEDAVKLAKNGRALRGDTADHQVERIAQLYGLCTKQTGQPRSDDPGRS